MICTDITEAPRLIEFVVHTSCCGSKWNDILCGCLIAEIPVFIHNHAVLKFLKLGRRKVR